MIYNDYNGKTSYILIIICRIKTHSYIYAACERKLLIHVAWSVYIPMVYNHVIWSVAYCSIINNDTE